MEDCLESGASDFSIEDDIIEITCEPNEVSDVNHAMTDLGYKVLSAEAEQIPSNRVSLTDEDAVKKMNLLLETLEDHDDVQEVYHNWDMPAE